MNYLNVLSDLSRLYPSIFERSGNINLNGINQKNLSVIIGKIKFYLNKKSFNIGEYPKPFSSSKSEKTKALLSLCKAISKDTGYNYDSIKKIAFFLQTRENEAAGIHGYFNNKGLIEASKSKVSHDFKRGIDKAKEYSRVKPSKSSLMPFYIGGGILAIIIFKKISK
jgi:hypothetical protein